MAAEDDGSVQANNQDLPKTASMTQTLLRYGYVPFMLLESTALHSLWLTNRGHHCGWRD
ncbi:Uncharacterised protein [Mycolicibacterium tokaiense]|uniref:Uncharacterized protein n=1 Tax=Mycolicibacterium tokaiense TaxID=39695 RepID=A0A379PJ57_9MYCO|nr:Uncharacterised protein [Mycolicibacterium tokaiense]